MGDRAALLDREAAVLAERLRHWTPRRWQAAAPPYAHRSEAAFELAKTFAELADAPARLPWVAEHVVPDQIAVTGHDLATAEIGDEVLEKALVGLRRTRELLGIS